MLSSVEQAFVGREEIRAPLKTPASGGYRELGCLQLYLIASAANIVVCAQ